MVSDQITVGGGVTEVIWPRIWQVANFPFKQNRGISWLVGEPLASQEGCLSVEFCS
jgi:hypothetical protein